jgi:hypothetical protein
MTGSMGTPQGRGSLTGGGSARAIAGRWPSLFFFPRDSTISRVGRAVCYAAVALGIVLRLLQLLANRSLSQDESMLALNIVHRPFSELFERLDFLQGAPAGFLVMQKLAVDALGNDEYSLRLVPFVAGTLALILIVSLAREAVTPTAVPVVVLLFAVSDPLINWTAYAKPYAVDVLVAVLVLWVGLRVLRRPERLSVFVLFAALGAAAIWFSNSSVFVLAGVSTAFVGGALVRKEWRHAAVLSIASTPWLVSFGVFAFTLLHNLSAIQGLECSTCFPGGTSGSSPSSGLHSLRGSLGEFRYAAGIPHFLDTGNNDAGLLVFFIALGFCLIGLRSLAARRPEAGVILLAPLIFMLIAWGLHKYPTLGRTQLFLVPNFVLLVGEGAAYAATIARRLSMRAVIAACTGVVSLAVAAPSLGHVAHPRAFEDMKPVLRYLARNQRTDDVLYVYYTAQYQFRYYLECRCAGAAFETARRAGLWPTRPGPGGHDEFASALLSVLPRFIVPPYRGRDPSNYVSDLEALRGHKRVWFLLSSLEDPRKTFLLHQLDERGTRRAAFSTGKGKNAAGVYLYDMTRSAP